MMGLEMDQLAKIKANPICKIYCKKTTTGKNKNALCEINYLVVDEEYRRRGIAQKLFDYVLCNNSFESVSLEVRSNNDSAINFYLKNGFKVVSKRERYYGNIDGLLMVKEMM